MAKQSQMEIVLKHLNEFKTITSWEAIEKYRITRLSAIIHTLRHEKGLIISSTENGMKMVKIGFYIDWKV